MPRQRLPARVNGPYYLAARDKWRVRIIDGDGIRDLFFDSETEARRSMGQVAKKLTPVPSLLGDALVEWVREKERHGSAKPETCAGHLAAMHCFFKGHLTEDLNKITPRRAEAIYSKVITRPTVKSGKPLAAATHQCYRSLAHGFFLWAARKGYVGESPFRNVRPVGRANTGKPQLTLDEAKRYRDAAFALFDEHNDILALAAVVPLYLGLRATEMLSRCVRDLDCNGTMLRIDRGKTRNARRYLAIKATPLRSRLLRLASNRHPEELLFKLNRAGKPHRRAALWRAVHRVCVAARVPLVCTHSLRGLWATLGVESGAAETAVASALGHSSFEMTARHYAQPEAMSDARSERVAGFLDQRSPTPPLAPTPRPSAEKILAALPAHIREQLLRILIGGRAGSVAGKSPSDQP